MIINMLSYRQMKVSTWESLVGTRRCSSFLLCWTLFECLLGTSICPVSIAIFIRFFALLPATALAISSVPTACVVILMLIYFYLDFRNVVASISKFFSFLSFIVSVFFFFYCNIFYSFSINSCYFNWRLLCAFIIFYWLDFLDVSDCERLCCLCSKISF